MREIVKRGPAQHPLVDSATPMPAAEQTIPRGSCFRRLERGLCHFLALAVPSSYLPTMMMRATTTRARCGIQSRPCVVRAAQTESAPATKIEFGDLISIIKAVDSSDVVEMEVKGKRFAMCVKKQEALQAVEPVYITASAAPVPGAVSCDSAADPESAVTCAVLVTDRTAKIWPCNGQRLHACPEDAMPACLALVSCRCLLCPLCMQSEVGVVRGGYGCCFLQPHLAVDHQMKLCMQCSCCACADGSSPSSCRPCTSRGAASTR